MLHAHAVETIVAERQRALRQAAEDAEVGRQITRPPDPLRIIHTAAHLFRWIAPAGRARRDRDAGRLSADRLSADRSSVGKPSADRPDADRPELPAVRPHAA